MGISFLNLSKNLPLFQEKKYKNSPLIKEKNAILPLLLYKKKLWRIS